MIYPDYRAAIILDSNYSNQYSKKATLCFKQMRDFVNLPHFTMYLIQRQRVDIKQKGQPRMTTLRTYRT